MLAAGQKFLALPESDKTQWPFNPDTYLGHRGSKELETVTGVAHACEASDLHAAMQAVNTKRRWLSCRAQHAQLAAGNRLWEWYSVGRYGTAGYDVKAQKFAGEEWPEVGPTHCASHERNDP